MTLGHVVGVEGVPEGMHAGAADAGAGNVFLDEMPHGTVLKLSGIAWRFDVGGGARIMRAEETTEVVTTGRFPRERLRPSSSVDRASAF